MGRVATRAAMVFLVILDNEVGWCLIDLVCVVNEKRRCRRENSEGRMDGGHRFI